MLFNSDGSFYPYPVTNEEIDAARANPALRVSSLDESWRRDPLGDGPEKGKNSAQTR
jgi:hypothetical protein